MYKKGIDLLLKQKLPKDTNQKTYIEQAKTAKGLAGKENLTEGQLDAIYDEAMAMAIGDHGAGFAKGMQKENYASWYEKLWSSILKRLKSFVS